MEELTQAVAEIRELADRLARPDTAFARAAELAAEETRRQIDDRGLVSSGGLRASVYARGAEFGVDADHASFVEERRPFMPVEGGELAEPLASEVLALLESYVKGEG